MNPLILIAGLFVLYEVLIHQTGDGVFGTGVVVGTTAGVPASPGTSNPAAPPQSGVGPISYQLGAQGGGGMSTGSQAEVGGVVASLNFIPVVGPVVSAIAGLIAGGLMKASAQRAAEARTENSAVVKGVVGWDQGVTQYVAAYNAGKISAADVRSAFAVPQVNDGTLPNSQGLLWKLFWQEVGPQVQSGRNGCHSGADAQPANQSWCSGSYGAGCCVGYDNLKNSSIYMLRALNQAEANPGTAYSATTVTVYSSKYGGVNRPGYNVTFRKPVAAASSLFGL